MKDSIYHPFTVKYPNIVREIISEIGVSEPISAANIELNDSRILNIQALWDTGATNSVITKKTVIDLNLKPISVTQVNHAGGEGMANVFLVNIYLPNKLFIPGVRVTECPDTVGGFGAIIGMDIITMGDFSITNNNEKTTVSYRCPSIIEIDYTKELDLQMKFKKAEPYDPCPCGSGSKFKFCHGQKK